MSQRQYLLCGLCSFCFKRVPYGSPRFARGCSARRTLCSGRERAKRPNEPSARIARVKAPSLRRRADLESARRTPCSEQFLRQHSWSSGSSPKPSGSQICSGKSGLPILLQRQISEEQAQARQGVRGLARCGPFVCAEGCALKELRVWFKKQTR